MGKGKMFQLLDRNQHREGGGELESPGPFGATLSQVLNATQFPLHANARVSSM